MLVGYGAKIEGFFCAAGDDHIIARSAIEGYGLVAVGVKTSEEVEHRMYGPASIGQRDEIVFGQVGGHLEGRIEHDPKGYLVG